MSAAERLAELHQRIDRGEDVASHDYLEARMDAELEERQAQAAHRLAAQDAADAERERRRAAMDIARADLPVIVRRMREKVTAAITELDDEIAAADAQNRTVNRVLNRNAVKFAVDEIEDIWLPSILAALDGTVAASVDPPQTEPRAGLSMCLYGLHSEVGSWGDYLDLVPEIEAARAVLEPLEFMP